MATFFTSPTDRSQTVVSSRPERTQISCHAALDRAACAPFCKGKAHEVHQRHQVPQEVRGSEVEGSAVQRTRLGNDFHAGVYPHLVLKFPIMGELLPAIPRSQNMESTRLLRIEN